MNFGGHLITGWLISQSKSTRLAERRLITAIALAPDLDGLFFFIPGYYEAWHRTFGHNVFFAGLIPLVTILIFGQRRGLKLLPLAYLAMFSHFILDLFVTGWWELWPFWPVSEWGILMSLWIPETVMKYWLQIGLLGALIGIVVRRFRRDGRTPLELISPRFDSFITTFVTLPFSHHCTYCSNRAFYRESGSNAPVCGRHVSWRRLLHK